MTSKGPDWDTVISNLARHLAVVSDADQIERIVRDADRDLFRLRAPANFWSRVSALYERALEARVRSAPPPPIARRLLAIRSLAERAPSE
jgi:hypothetical protein